MNKEKRTLGSAIFSNIDSNAYLGKLYSKLLKAYGMSVFDIDPERYARLFNDKEKADVLRFADILAKSNDSEKADSHKIWAQEIVILMNELYPGDSLVKLYAGDVFSSVGNHKGIQLVNKDYSEPSALEEIFSQFRDEYLSIPAEPGEHFFGAQKIAYDHLTDDCFSYSAPTSMGKSFIMRMFIKDEIMNGAHKNYALIVPTKALINEVRAKVIDDLGGEKNTEKVNYLSGNNYSVVTAASDIALEEENKNFILVMTPERLLYLLIAKPGFDLDYLFIDEAHKLSGKNSRAPFYYKVVDMLLHRKQKPHFIFASPNIPNPGVYLRLMLNAGEGDENALAITYSPVVQIKFLVDLQNGKIEVYNEHAIDGQSRIKVANVSMAGIGLNDFLLSIEAQNSRMPSNMRKQSIVYYNGRDKAVDAAHAFYEMIKRYGSRNDPLLESLSKDIKEEVHEWYYLADMVRYGIAYHIGYLPASIRARIEELFQSGNITVMFCTSTLLEGVNLPAGNLFIMENKIARSEMNAIDFRNLIGRVGRISFNLYGNVFFVSEKDSKIKADDYVRMLEQEIPAQSLSIATDPKVLRPIEKKYVAEILKSGKSEIPKRETDSTTQSEESYQMMRKFALILQGDIVNDRDTLVRREFKDFLTPADEEHIREVFKDAVVQPDDDINTSVDQTSRLIAAIKRKVNSLHYPELVNGKFRYQDVLGFLNELANVFRWDMYESSTLGKDSLRRWYAVILCQWMEGGGLKFIMNRALEYHAQNPYPFWINKYGPPTTYNPKSDVDHNAVFGDTLEVIENIILYSIANYFLRFSNEYRKIKGDAALDRNNWYEFVEYGTTNPLTVLLQRSGFSRESARYIKDHREYVIKDGSTGELKLSPALADCGNTDVRNEVIYIRQNSPEIFEVNSEND
ncbi:DEAD/DEAH box helicase [Pseudoramibacter sp. HA2172]|uniref:DEAD/DEAH box helicase n=1 Tax=Pseudoramibacter faecis TaxID=3108534 RepID=UPI002E77363F|nr:DEAD/DEAH box helicase [Pseudoramibacter sp. HA2172]